MFLPRALTKGNKNQLKAPPRVTHAIPSSLSRDATTEKRDTPEVDPGPSDSAKGKSKDAAPNEDYASAILLALSDYAFWDDEEWAVEVKNGQGGGFRDVEDAGCTSDPTSVARHADGPTKTLPSGAYSSGMAPR